MTNRVSMGSMAMLSLLVSVTAPGDAQQIYACYHTGEGNLRIVKSLADCKKNEAPLSWNKEGPPGPKGDPGPIGPVGPQGPGGAIPAAAALLFSSCPAGWVAAGPPLGGLSLLIPCVLQTVPASTPPPIGLGNVNSSLLVNQLDFGSQPMDQTTLAALLQRADELQGAGDSSSYAVALSYDVLNRVEGATLAKRNFDVEYYDPAGNRANYLVTVNGARLGVLVTRAFIFPPSSPYSPEQAAALLISKLTKAQYISSNMKPAENVARQILFIFASDPQVLSQLQNAFNLIEAAVKGNTLVYVTVTHGEDMFLYN